MQNVIVGPRHVPPLPLQTLDALTTRTFAVYAPDAPSQVDVPAIIMFHGGDGDAQSAARVWGVAPGRTPPRPLDGYLLIFPEADPTLGDGWLRYRNGNNRFPMHDLLFVEQLLEEITTTEYPTGDATYPLVKADADHVYAAGFSNGAGLVWQLMNSDLVGRFQGFAAVGHALEPEQALQYRDHLQAAAPVEVPAIYVHGTADHGFSAPATLKEVPIDTTHPAHTVQEMLTRNGVAPGTPAVTTLAPGTTNGTEVVIQLFAGIKAFEYVTVVGGGHNWPAISATPDSDVAGHFDATREIVEFWQAHASLPA